MNYLYLKIKNLPQAVLPFLLLFFWSCASYNRKAKATTRAKLWLIERIFRARAALLTIDFHIKDYTLYA